MIRCNKPVIQNSWDLPELVDTGSDPHEDFHTYAIDDMTMYHSSLMMS